MGYLQLSLAGLFWPSKPVTSPTDITIDLTLAYPPCPRPSNPPVSPHARPANLPTELILNILEEASLTPRLEPDTSVLLACSLVCKAWSGPAQTLLFRQVSLRSQRSYIAFSSAVTSDSERSRSLAFCVKALNATIDPSQPFRLLPRSFARATTMCHNLQQVELTLYGSSDAHAGAQNVQGYPLSLARHKNPTPTFDQRTLDILRSASCTVTSLRFTNWSTNFSALPQLVSVWPSLRHLFLRGFPPQLVPGAQEPCSLQLSSLTLDFPPAPSREFLDWLLHGTEKEASLQSLHVSFNDTDMLEHLLVTHGSKLRSLSLPIAKSSSLAVISRECGVLESLSVERSAVFRLRDGSSLTGIALGVDGNTYLGPLLACLESGTSLDRVLLMLWKGGQSHPLLPALRKRCAEIGVACRTVKDVEVFRAVVRANPVS